jgi:hypothetical protein
MRDDYQQLPDIREGIERIERHTASGGTCLASVENGLFRNLG